MKSRVSNGFRSRLSCLFAICVVGCGANASMNGPSSAAGTSGGGLGALAANGQGGAIAVGSSGSSAAVGGASGRGGANGSAGSSTTGPGDVGLGTGTGGARGSAGNVAGTGGASSAAGTGGAGSGASGTASAGTGGGSGSTAGDACAPGPSPLVGWASVTDNGVTTTGGDGGSKVSVSDLAALTSAVKGTTKQIIEITGSIAGSITIGSNKTLVGCAGAQFKGHISMNGSANVIVRNLMVVGNNCTDNPSDCSGGEDAITVQGAAHHLWFDHDDISDGSDGNLDLTHASDFVTISWTKFHYSGRRTDPAGAAGGHQFSNLVGHDDNNKMEDTGHLRISFHHDWWADNVVERMPRVRFGHVHIFNNLYTASGNDYCIGVGVGANILTENNVFIGVAVPINTTSYSDAASVIHSSGNVYTGTSGAAPADLSAANVFTPGYVYTPESTTGLEAAIRSGAGPR